MIVALVALFAVAFVVLRQRSGFLAIEADEVAAVPVAAAYGLALADVFALRELVGARAPREVWRAAAAEFATLRERLGEPLAAVAVAGEREAAEQARAAAADAATAWARFGTDPRAAAGHRFLHVRDRFAQRIGARD
ncbi:MAG: hypothetical protein JNL08_06595 [Planctomycetes bacterium]|nr:hypothetical protein [Planctomycetota bacterium]